MAASCGGVDGRAVAAGAEEDDRLAGRRAAARSTSKPAEREVLRAGDARLRIFAGLADVDHQRAVLLQAGGRGGIDALQCAWHGQFSLGLVAERLWAHGQKICLRVFEEAHRPRVGDPVVERLRFAAERDQAVVAQPRKMLRQRRLAEADGVGERGDGHLAAGGEMAQDQQPVLVGEQLQKLGGLVGLLPPSPARACACMVSRLRI